MYSHKCILNIAISYATSFLSTNRENVIFVMDHQMDDFDPYAEPKLNFEQTQSPPAPRLQAELQDVDPHLTLSYNGLLHMAS